MLHLSHRNLMAKNTCYDLELIPKNAGTSLFMDDYDLSLQQ